jgi:hypothetical protein
MIFGRAGRRFIQPHSVTLLREPIQWVDTTRYLWVNIDKQLTWLPLIDQVRKRIAQRMGLLVPSRKGGENSPSGTEFFYTSSLSARDGLYVPRLEDRCTHPRPEAAGATIQVSSYATGFPWFLSNRQIHEYLGVPLFADHIGTLTACFNSKLADVGNHLFWQLGRYIR